MFKLLESDVGGLINGIAIDGEEFRIKKIMDLYNNQNSKEVLKNNRDTLNFKNTEALEKIPKMGSSDPDSLEWIALVGQLKKHMHLGYSNTRIQNIIKRMDVKKDEDFNDEDAFLDKLWDIRMSPVESEKYNLYPMDQEVLNFMEKAYIHYLGH